MLEEDKVDDFPLHEDSKIEFNELVVHREIDRLPILGCPLARRFLEVDETTVLAVEALRTARTLGAAERRLTELTGQDFDLERLVRMLASRGFVRTIDDVSPAPLPRPSRLQRLLNRLKPEQLQWLQRPIWVWIIGAMAFAWMLALIQDPTLRPHFNQLRVSDRPGLVMVYSFFGMLGFAVLHELAHYYMARSYGVESTIRLRHRLLILVLETDVTNAWVLKPIQRIRIFLAGIGFNVLVASLSTLLAWIQQHGVLLPSPRWITLLQFAAFLNVLALFFQLLFFARTDLYYVLSIVLKERNLASDARRFLKLLVVRLGRRLTAQPATACPRCRRATFDDEPFCFGCGESQSVVDPNKYPFAYSSRRKLLVFGFLSWPFQIYAFYYVMTVAILFQRVYVVDSLTRLSNAIQPGTSVPPAELIEPLLVFFVVGAQMVLLYYFLLEPLIHGLRRWRRKRRRAATPSFTEASGGSRG